MEFVTTNRRFRVCKSDVFTERGVCVSIRIHLHKEYHRTGGERDGKEGIKVRDKRARGNLKFGVGDEWGEMKMD